VTAPSATESERRPIPSRILAALPRFAMVGILLLMIVVFSLLRPESFGTFDKQRAIGNTHATVLLALAAMMPLIVGEFDFSVGAIFALSQTICVGLVIEHGWSVPLAIIVAICIGIVAGTINGLLVAKLGLGSFVATLATSGILAGLTLLYSGGETIFGDAPKMFTDISRSELFGIQLPIYYALAIALVLGVLLASFPIGRRLYAIGSNRRAAHLMGIPDDRYVVGTFVFSGIISAIGGVVLGAEIGAASAEGGLALLIPAFSGAFLGATAITPGRFNVWGTVIAVYLVAVTITGLQQLGAALWVTPVFNGAVLLVAVSLSLWTGNMRARRARAARLEALDRDAERGGLTPVEPDQAVAGSAGG
jgi:ribose transport system permease protein